jgi:gamma-glutamylcysteine synthetase
VPSAVIWKTCGVTNELSWGNSSSKAKNCQKVVKKNGQKVVKKLSKSCQKAVKKLSKSCKKLSKSCQKVVKKLSKKLSKSCQKIDKKLSKKLSKSCQKVENSTNSGGGLGWGNSGSKAFGISFADRPKAKSTTAAADHVSHSAVGKSNCCIFRGDTFLDLSFVLNVKLWLNDLFYG